MTRTKRTKDKFNSKIQHGNLVKVNDKIYIWFGFCPKDDNLRSFIIPLFSFDFQERILYFNGTMIFCSSNYTSNSNWHSG